MAGESPYVLSRGEYASMRLNLQHYLWKDALGYLLHPAIPVEHPENLKIADLGTGTGIWLLDLARGFPPTTQFDGFDISTAQYPAHEHLPANVRLKVLDSVNGEPPEDLQGQYDVVHLRLFISVIEKDPLPLLLNSLKLLRPGGYIQWDECDPFNTIAVGLHDELVPNSDKLVNLLTRVAKTRWVIQLPDLFKETKLECIRHEFSREHAWQRKLASDTMCALAKEIVSTVFDHDLEEARDLRNTIRGAYAEICEGAYISQSFNVALGRKPGVV